MNIHVSSDLWRDVKGTNELRKCCMILKIDLKIRVCAGKLRKCNSTSLYSSIIIPYFLLCDHRIFLGGKVLNLFPWTSLSVTSTKSPTTYRAANRNRIGTIVSKLTTIEDGCVSVCVDVFYCWRILSWIPLTYSERNTYIHMYLLWGAYKSLARPERKQTTLNKFGIYSTHPWGSSTHFLASCCNLCKHTKKL
jgi:hypothetical protein